MAAQSRNSGLDIIGSVPWGTHFCQFYQTKKDLEEILVPYFKAGLEANEFCMWVTSSDLSKKQAEIALGKAVPNFKECLAKGQIEIIPYTDWYLKNGQFELQRVLNGWVEKLKQGAAKGFEGLRLTGNTVWLEKKDWQNFTDYEEAINRVIGQYRMIALCTYSLKKCGAMEIMDVVRNHEFALIKSGKRWDMIQTSEQKEKEAALRKANRTLKALSQSSQAMMRATEEKAYLEQVCKIIVEDCGHAMVWIGFAEEDAEKRVRPVVYSGFEKGYLDTLNITWADTERGRGPTGTAIRTGQPTRCRNMQTDPKFKAWRAEALKRGYQSSIAVPLLAQGKAFGALTLYSSDPDPFTDDEVDLLVKLADDLAYGIWALRLRKENAKGEEALRGSEERYRTLFETMIEGFCIIQMVFDASGKAVDYRFLETNPAFEVQTGFQNAKGKLIRELAPDLEAHWFETFGKIAITGEPARFEEAAKALGRWYEVFAYRVGAPEERRVAVVFSDITERKRTEKRLNLLAETSSQLLQSDSPQKVVNGLCHKMKDFLDCDVFFNFMVDEEKGCLHLNTCGGIPEEEARKIEWLDYGAAVCGCAARDGCRIVAENIQETPDPRTELVKSYGIQAYACHPLIAQGKVIGTLSFGSRKKTKFCEDELSLMKAVADHVAIAMERKRAQEVLQRTNVELEQRVAERTAEVRKNSRFLEAFFHHSMDSLVFLDKEFNFIRVNEAYARGCQRNVADFPGHNHFDFFPHAENEVIFGNVVRTKTPYMAIARPFEFADHPEWGVTYWDWTLVPVLDAQGDIDFLVLSLRDVSKREKAEKQLRAASRYARSLLEASLDPLVTISPEGKITDVNEATELATGRDRAHLIGSDFSYYFTQPERAKEGYRKVIAEGFVRDYSLTLRHVSGRTMDVLYNASLYRNESGEVQGVFAAARDVTARKQMEEKLRSASLYARSLIEASLDPLVTISPEGKITDVNLATERVTGVARDPLIGSDFSHYFTEPQKAAIGYQIVLAQGMVQDYPLTIRHADGHTTDVLYNATVYRNEAGEVQGVFAAARDITERRLAEKRRDVTNALLALFAQKTSAKEYLEAVAAVLRDWSGAECLGIRLVDNDGNMLYKAALGFPAEFLQVEGTLSLKTDSCCCTRAAQGDFEGQEKGFITENGSFHFHDSLRFVKELTPLQLKPYRGNCMKFGYTSMAIIPIRDKDEILGLIHLADKRPAHFSAGTVEFLESMSPMIGEAVRRFQAETELANYRGHLEELVQQRTSQLESANAQLHSEVKERIRAEVAVRNVAQELARSNLDLEQFAYVASHDLQEPLRAVAGYVGLLQRRYPERVDAKGQHYIESAMDGAIRMQRLIEDLLSFSRVQTKGKTFASANLSAALDRALLNLQITIQESGAEVTSDPLPTLPVDASQITQVFQNLIGNGIKFRGEEPPKIHIAAEQREGDWTFSVRDNGIGMESQYFERIFQIFQRLHTRKHYSGTGIGLAICKKIVERHGGKIWVESQPGHGSTFYFSLPEKEAFSSER